MVEAPLEPDCCEECGGEISDDEPEVTLEHINTRVVFCFHARCALIAYRAATEQFLEWKFFYLRRGGAEAW